MDATYICKNGFSSEVVWLKTMATVKKDQLAGYIL